MQVTTFPTATFALTSPVELGAKENGGRIGVVGSTVVTFADDDIDNPSNGFAQTANTGTLEPQLVFDKAG